MRGPVNDAVIKDLLAYASDRVSVCLEQRVCPTSGQISPLFCFFPSNKRVGGCFETA
jgi:hypothetical protein